MTTAQYKKQYTTILQYVLYVYMYKHKHTYNAHDKNSNVQK